MSKTTNRELFLFAAKAGALEGYLYRRRKPEPLANWVGNIHQMYQELPTETKREVAPVLAPVLEKILKYGDKIIEPPLKGKLQQLLASVVS